MAISTTTALIMAATAATGAYGANQQKKAAQAAAKGPDLTAAQIAGVQADLASLVMRLQVNQAAQDGGVYTDPETGKKYDFRGKFDPVRFAKANPAAVKEWIEAKAQGEYEGWSEEEFAKAYLGGDDAALKPYMTGSAEYKIQTEAINHAQRTKAGTDLAIDTARTQLGAYAGQPDYAAYVRNDPGLLKYWQDTGSKEKPEYADMAAWGKAHYEASGKKEGRTVPMGGLLTQTNDLNLQTQNTAFNSALDANQKSNAAHLANQQATHTANLGANDLSFNANLAQSGKAAQTSLDLQNKIVPQLNDLQLRNQNAAFNQNLGQASAAAANAAQQQYANLPGLNDLSLRLQGDAYREGDTVGRQVNGGLYSVRDLYAAQLADEFKSGADLTPAQRNRVQQRIRGAQASRGNILGDGAAFDEAIAESDYAQTMIDRRRAAALGLINARDLNPRFNAMGVINPTQLVVPNSTAYTNITNPVQTVAVNNAPPNFSTVGPLSPNFSATTIGPPNLTPNVAPPTDPLALLNPNAGNTAANQAMNVWQTNTGIKAGTPNAWMQALGLGLEGWAYVNNKPVATTTPPMSSRRPPWAYPPKT